jgi:hypothetical protein
MRGIVRPTLALTAVLLTCGCRSSTARMPIDTSAVAQATPAGQPQPVADTGPQITVRAYINVSSGCQQKTVDLLQRLDRENDRLTVEMIDFGSPEGNRRWREDGLSCMTILVNEHKTVTFGDPGHRRIVTFQYPPGFQWIPEDLERSIKDALAGKLFYGEEPGATKIESRLPTLHLTSRQATLGGRKVGEVLINGQVAIRFRTTYQGLPPLQRAEQAVGRIKRLLAGSFTPGQLRVTKVDSEVVLAAVDKVICVADAPQARLVGTTPIELAKSWGMSLRKALVTAMGKGQ